MAEKDQLASRVLGIASIVGATALAWTVSRKSKKTIALMNNSAWSIQHPKAAAYIFAGQAFGTATVLVACSGFTLAMLISMTMDVGNMQEFHHKMTHWAQTTFPQMHASKDFEDDDSHLELVKEWIAALDEPLSESETTSKISTRLRKGLGLE